MRSSMTSPALERAAWSSSSPGYVSLLRDLLRKEGQTLLVVIAQLEQIVNILLPERLLNDDSGALHDIISILSCVALVKKLNFNIPLPQTGIRGR